MTSTLQPDPLYFTTTTSNTVWPPKIYLQVTGIKSLGVCSSLCSLDAGICQLFVFTSSTGVCNLGQLANSLTVVPTSSGTAVRYTRKCKFVEALPFPCSSYIWKKGLDGGFTTINRSNIIIGISNHLRALGLAIKRIVSRLDTVIWKI